MAEQQKQLKSVETQTHLSGGFIEELLEIASDKPPQKKRGLIDRFKSWRSQSKDPSSPSSVQKPTEKFWDSCYALEWDRKFTDKPKGIPNVGNACYMNALLQVLCWTPHLGETLTSQLHTVEIDNNSETPQSISSFLLDLIVQTHYDRRPMIDRVLPTMILNEARKLNSQFNGRNPQDSYELFSTIISGMEDKANKWTRQELKREVSENQEVLMTKSPVSRLFSGVFLIIYNHETCNHIETVFQRFTSICVPVSPDVFTKEFVDIDMPEENEYSFNYSDRSLAEKDVQEQCHADRCDKTPVLLKDEINQEAQSQIGPNNSDIRTYSPEHLTEINGQFLNTGDDGLTLHEANKYGDDQDNYHNSTGCTNHVNKTRKGHPQCFQTLQEPSKNMTDLEKGLTELTDIEEFSEGLLPCKTCKDTTIQRTKKRLLVISPPSILVLQMNKVQQEKRKLKKLNINVEYPSILNMAPFCSNGIQIEALEGQKAVTKGIWYDLYGIVCHRKVFVGYHYTAYVRTTFQNSKKLKTDHWTDPQNCLRDIKEMWVHEKCEEKINELENCKHTWFHISDTQVTKCNGFPNDETAYLLMYERI